MFNRDKDVDMRTYFTYIELYEDDFKASRLVLNIN